MQDSFRRVLAVAIGTSPSTTALQPLLRRAAICSVATLVALLAVAFSSRAAELEGLHFAESVRVEEHELDLRGLALLRYRIVFRAYVAAFYLPPQTPSDAALSDVPKRLEVLWAMSPPPYFLVKLERDFPVPLPDSSCERA